MADEYGVPQPECAEDWQQFMLGIFDIIEMATNVGADANGVRLLSEAREVFKGEFARRFPGYGKGRAVW
jgi:hypothetical protein